MKQDQRFVPTRGDYVGTTDNRADRWYIDDRESNTIDRRGAGFTTRKKCQEEIDRRNA